MSSAVIMTGAMPAARHVTRSVTAVHGGLGYPMQGAQLSHPCHSPLLSELVATDAAFEQ